MQLKRNDLNSIHDVVYDVTGASETDERLIARFEALPDHIKSIAEEWGANDTVFCDELQKHLEKKDLPKMNEPEIVIFSQPAQGKAIFGEAVQKVINSGLESLTNPEKQIIDNVFEEMPHPNK